MAFNKDPMKKVAKFSRKKSKLYIFKLLATQTMNIQNVTRTFWMRSIFIIIFLEQSSQDAKQWELLLFLRHSSIKESIQ